jgi:hypothetical protein
MKTGRVITAGRRLVATTARWARSTPTDVRAQQQRDASSRAAVNGYLRQRMLRPPDVTAGDNKRGYACIFNSATESCNGVDDNCNGRSGYERRRPRLLQVCGVSPNATGPAVLRGPWARINNRQPRQWRVEVWLQRRPRSANLPPAKPEKSATARDK